MRILCSDKYTLCSDKYKKMKIWNSCLAGSIASGGSPRSGHFTFSHSSVRAPSRFSGHSMISRHSTLKFSTQHKIRFILLVHINLFWPTGWQGFQWLTTGFKSHPFPRPELPFNCCLMSSSFSFLPNQPFRFRFFPPSLSASLCLTGSLKSELSLFCLSTPARTPPSWSALYLLYIWINLGVLFVADFVSFLWPLSINCFPYTSHLYLFVQMCFFYLHDWNLCPHSIVYLSCKHFIIEYPPTLLFLPCGLLSSYIRMTRTAETRKDLITNLSNTCA